MNFPAFQYIVVLKDYIGNEHIVVGVFALREKNIFKSHIIRYYNIVYAAARLERGDRAIGAVCAFNIIYRRKFVERVNIKVARQNKSFLFFQKQGYKLKLLFSDIFLKTEMCVVERNISLLGLEHELYYDSLLSGRRQKIFLHTYKRVGVKRPYTVVAAVIVDGLCKNRRGVSAYLVYLAQSIFALASVNTYIKLLQTYKIRTDTFYFIGKADKTLCSVGIMYIICC